MAKRIRAALVHGFWGSEQSWQPIIEILKKSGAELDLFIPNLFSEGPFSSRHSFKEWSANFVTEKRKRFGAEPVLLVGYSLGGRLALHAAAQSPEDWSGLFLLSVNPGLKVNQEERRKWEFQWSKKFLENSWESLDLEWNQQEVFKNSQVIKQEVSADFSRELLALAFTNWSLTQHEFKVDDLQKNCACYAPAQCQWWFGKQDQKFVAVAEHLHDLNVNGLKQIIPAAGHRLPWDAADRVAHEVLKLAPPLQGE